LRKSRREEKGVQVVREEKTEKEMRMGRKTMMMMIETATMEILIINHHHMVLQLLSTRIIIEVKTIIGTLAIVRNKEMMLQKMLINQAVL
jgi:hypothetical protein